MIDAVKNIFNVPDLRKRILFMLAMLGVYRIGAFIPTPGIDVHRWTEFFTRTQGSIFGFFDLFAGGNIRRLSIFALGTVLHLYGTRWASRFIRRPPPAPV